MKIDVWHDLLKHMDFEQAQRNLREHIMSNRFPPTPADITKFDPVRESERKSIAARNMEIALNRWICDGNDPEDFDWGIPNEPNLLG